MVTEGQWWIALKLANFNLIDENKRLLMTTTKRGWVYKAKKHFAEINPDEKYLVKNFAIRVLSQKHRNAVVIKWRKIKGYSLWQVLPVK
ncbi:MAG: hypothetical protein A2Y67_02910 [Candidatus Buchananbacteria bacterium RBG_13_39_9]|uniref:Uncharacterized protein n=1 Tax=Candidatus Buchananbacteria bacterium RBG_13_39_9 TaxID=1797531 RepID=A0A1G1XQZ4_9BACT|nr:MAG: hypothetical protein A2Y67_02910 [Candidatus Buchananbacteria bacterium RBG_13_39_9]